MAATATTTSVSDEFTLNVNNNNINKAKRASKINLALLTTTQLLGGLTFSLLSPFYTEEATQKGLTVTQSSWVYGSAFVTTIAFSPVFGKYIQLIGSRKLFLYGTFLAGATNVLFGFLQWIKNPQSFLALSIIGRIIMVNVFKSKHVCMVTTCNNVL